MAVLLRVIAILLTAVAVAALPLPVAFSKNPALEVLKYSKRAQCNADNMLRLLRNPTILPEAIPFCQTYLGRQSTIFDTVYSTITERTTIVTQVVSDVSETYTLTRTATDTATDIITVMTELTKTVSTDTATAIDTISKTDTLSLTNSVTQLMTVYTTILITTVVRTTDTTTTTEVLTSTQAVSITLTRPTTVLKKRAPPTPLSVQLATGTYPPSRISSACSCLTIPVEYTTTSITKTITRTSTETTELVIISTKPITSFNTARITQTVQATTTQEQTIDETATVTTSITNTILETAFVSITQTIPETTELTSTSTLFISTITSVETITISSTTVVTSTATASVERTFKMRYLINGENRWVGITSGGFGVHRTNRADGSNFAVNGDYVVRPVSSVKQYPQLGRDFGQWFWKSTFSAGETKTPGSVLADGTVTFQFYGSDQLVYCSDNGNGGAINVGTTRAGCFYVGTVYADYN